MSYTERNKILSVRISEELLDKLDEKAQKNNCTRSDYVLALLGKNAGVKVEPPKVWGEERIIVLENKLKELEEKIISPDNMNVILGQVLAVMRQTGNL